MLIDDIREKIKAIEPDIATITAFWQNARLEQRFQELHAQSNQEEFWKNPDQATILKELQRLRLLREQFLAITTGKQELAELAELFQNDAGELQKISHDLTTLVKEVTAFKISLLLNDPQDS